MSRRPSVMKHNFSMIPQVSMPRSSFNRSHGYKTTFDSGYLVPFFVDEALPGDTFKLKASIFSRLATPIVPIMDNMFMDTFFFAVPYRLVWDNFQKFCGEQTNPGDSTDYEIPQLKAPDTGFPVGSIADYFGLPTRVPKLSVSSLPFRAYNLIWNEWFRDQNLQDSLPVPTGDGPDDMSLYKLQRRAKRHDYFTSALPWPQKGPAVDLPIGAMAPISGTIPSFSGGSVSYSANGKPITLSQLDTSAASGYGPVSGSPGKLNTGGGSVNYPITANVTIPSHSFTGTADLSEATAASINSLRLAFQIQRLLELNARGGTRYTEIIRSHFKVVSPDARLQRPEYLGGSSTRINVTPVQQTSSSDGSTPQGNLAAFGVGSDVFHGFTKSFTEHCFIIGFINVRADLTYQQGINRMWSRLTRYDHYWPTLSHLGEQAILSKEIYADGTAADEDVFGYQERYAEYRYKPSLITGKLRSTDPQSLDVWHLSQHFKNRPVLNHEFIEDKPPVERVIAVQDEPQFILDTYFNLHCARPMPLYSVPGLIDHF